MTISEAVTQKYIGISIRPFIVGLDRSRTPYLVRRKMMAAKAPDKTGAMIQARKTCGKTG